MRLRSKLIVVIVVLAAAMPVARRVGDYYRAATLVVQTAGVTGWPRALVSWHPGRFSESPVELTSRHGPVRARLYRPEGRLSRTIVLVTGVHAMGIDEPRLVTFARHLAAEHVAVVTPELPELRRYAITSQSTDTIEDATRQVAARDDLAPDGRVGLVGVSFSGGLCLVAAGRASLKGRLAFVLSFGGHGDFPRTLRYLCTGLLQNGERRPPHDYGVAVVLLNVADELVPPAQLSDLRTAILTFLRASHLDMVDKPKAQQEFANARRLQQALSEPAATLMDYVNKRDVTNLGIRLLPHLERFSSDTGLSPERSDQTSAPVFLMHGADDNVIPSAETLRVAEYLRARTSVRMLITPLIGHADVVRPMHVRDVCNLIAFWTDVLTM